MKTFDPQSTTTRDFYQLLSSSVTPRPIALASTMDAAGLVNLAPFSFFNVVGANPPIVVFSPNKSIRSGADKHTLQNVRQVPEVVINLVSYDMVHQTDIAGLDYPAGVNEFEKSGFTPLASELVRPPRVAQSPVQFECKVLQVIETGIEGGAGNLILAQVLRIHVQEQLLDEKGRIDPLKMDLVGRLGGDYYVRNLQAAFQVPKQADKLGIGMDQLPENARSSTILTANQLAIIARQEALPSAQILASQRRVLKTNQHLSLKLLHQKVQTHLKMQRPDLALALLVAIEEQQQSQQSQQ